MSFFDCPTPVFLEHQAQINFYSIPDVFLERDSVHILKAILRLQLDYGD